VESITKLLSGDKSSLLQDPPSTEDEGICRVACCRHQHPTRPESSKTTLSKFRISERVPSYFSLTWKVKKEVKIEVETSGGNATTSKWN